jgi:hypothetical protein
MVVVNEWGAASFIKQLDPVLDQGASMSRVRPDRRPEVAVPVRVCVRAALASSSTPPVSICYGRAANRDSATRFLFLNQITVLEPERDLLDAIFAECPETVCADIHGAVAISVDAL